MEPKLTLSVIVPCYNSCKTVIRAIESINNQTLLPDEIVVVDDGSTDGTPELVESTFPSVKVIRQKNSGAATARNVGVRNSSGLLIAFLDSDDFWHRQKLEAQLQIMKSNPDVGICSTKYIFLQEATDLNFKELSTTPIDNDEFRILSFKDVFQNPGLATPSVVMRRKIFDKVGGFDESRETAEDVDLWLKTSFESLYAVSSSLLTYVIVQKSSLSHTSKKSPHQSHIEVIDDFIKCRKLSFFFKFVVVRQVKSKIYCYWGSSLLVLERRTEAQQKLLKSLFFMPNIRALYLLFKSIYLLTAKSF